MRFVGDTSYFTIVFDNTKVTTTFWQGRPRNALGTRRILKLSIMDKTNQDAIRKEIAQKLVRSTRDVREGTTQITEFPYSMLDAKIDGTPSGSGGTTRTFSIKELWASALLTSNAASGQAVVSVADSSIFTVGRR